MKEKELLRKILSRIGKKGGHATAQRLTPAQRTARARKGGLARQAKARQRKGGAQ